MVTTLHSLQGKTPKPSGKVEFFSARLVSWRVDGLIHQIGKPPIPITFLFNLWRNLQSKCEGICVFRASKILRGGGGIEGRAPRPLCRSPNFIPSCHALRAATLPRLVILQVSDKIYPFQRPKHVHLRFDRNKR